MTVFSYTAIDAKGTTITGTVEQPDRAGVIDALAKQKLRPVSIQETKEKTASTSVGTILGAGRVKPDQLVMFTRQLSAMVGAGVPLLRALSAIADHVAESPVLKRILSSVIFDVEAGLTLGDALAKYPNTFDDV